MNTETPKAKISARNLNFYYGKAMALKGINLDIHHNEFLTLLGPSGCGKTTTLRIIAGFEEATVKNLTLIREQGAMAAYKSCL